ncbi:TetR/AcrR family transcriptional regulator [Actinoplanes sp. G11-F43]|uniref:TetR/AcrR family transcriptional regulator n=1 Tax=Actinoplanes sp. G11-F43 TaxID=3424130 RepID=UPI003D353563
MTDSTTARRGRGRRPAAEVRANVLEATGRLLLEEGIQAITFDRVAKEAGSSKMTLYKWWPTPGALVAEAYFSRSQPVLEFPDTGDIRTDLITQLRSFVHWLTGAGRTVTELIGAAQLDPELARAWAHHYATPRRELARARLATARDQGQLTPEADLHIIVDQLWGACYHRLLVLMVPLDDTIVERLVDQALYGAANPSGGTPGGSTEIG